MVWLGKDSCRSTTQNKNKNSPTDQRSYISHLSLINESSLRIESSVQDFNHQCNLKIFLLFSTAYPSKICFRPPCNMSCCSLKVAGSNPVLGKFLIFFSSRRVKTTMSGGWFSLMGLQQPKEEGVLKWKRFGELINPQCLRFRKKVHSDHSQMTKKQYSHQILHKIVQSKQLSKNWYALRISQKINFYVQISKISAH